MVRRHESNPAYVEQLITGEESWTMNPNMINIVAEPREPVLISLVGVEYKIMPPKAAFGLKLAVKAKLAGENDPASMGESMELWVMEAFGKTEGHKVLKRLDSPGDDLDYPHIAQLMQALTEAATGDPTTSPSDTPVSP